LSEEIASRVPTMIGDPRDVSISIEANQSSGDRALPQGATLRRFENVKLTIHVAGTGYLSIYDLDESALVYPVDSAPWFVLEGSWGLGESAPVLFQPSDFSSTRQFLVAFCEAPVYVVDFSAIHASLAEERCLMATSTVEWEPRR
jgi:hypothetical protein